MRLDPYRNIVDFYDCEHDTFSDDIAFYLDHLSGGPVLDVGAGTGRVTRALLRSGLEVWGVDPSFAMLDRAQARLADFPDVHLVHGTISDLPPELRFGTAIVPLNTLWHLPDNRSQIALLREIRTRLADGGILMVDLSNPLTLLERGARGEYRERFSGPCRDGNLTVLSATWDDEASQELSTSLTYDVTDRSGLVKRTHATFHFRYLYRYELELVLREGGFEQESVYGSYDEQPYQADSPNIIVIGRAL